MPITPGYYRPREDDGDLPAGTRVYATGTEGDQVRFLRHNLSYHTPLARFLALYEEFSGGAVDYQREVAEHLQHTHQANERLTAQIAAAANVQPHLGSAGSLLGTGDLEPGHATNESSHLPLASGESGAISAKRLAAQLRNTLAKATVTLKARQEALARVLAEQTAILSERMRTLAELTATAKEAIWTINIYLGADEEIVRLAAGEPAGAATPISVRQLVLYMDEECGLRAGDGGLDARMIEQFDAWILADPTHLAQILPEPKGLVALKPRRRRRDYDDPWLAKTMEEENKKTYFLLRNGENLYRLCTSYEVGEIVVPREQEFANLFLEKTHRYRPDGTLAWETVPMQPGSQAYMRAEKAASARTRHYFRMALLLQGLLDRTTVFRPIARAILVTNPAQSDGLLHFIIDGDRTIDDGRPAFFDWLTAINASLGPGSRIVGAFATDRGLRQYDYERQGGNSRLSPARAVYPASRHIFILEGRRRDGFYFCYERANDWQDYQKRASCQVRVSDRFILNFDLARPEDLHYYLAKRTERANYEELLPLLRAALALKEAEHTEEAPFLDLLTSQIAGRHGGDLDAARTAAGELAQWWKLKNRIHRGLLSDDRRALRMILVEYDRRTAIEAANGAAGDHVQAGVIAHIQAQAPDALVIGQLDRHTFACLVPANDETIWTHEHRWHRHRQTGILTPGATRSWVLPDHRHAGWAILHASERWAVWTRNASRSLCLTDPEAASLARELLRQFRARRPGGQPLQIWRAVRDREILFHLSYLETGNPHTVAHAGEPRVFLRQRPWRRSPTGEARLCPEDPYQYATYLTAERFTYWSNADVDPHRGPLYWRDDPLVAAFTITLTAHAAEREHERQRVNYRQTILQRILDQAAIRDEQQAYERFLRDFGDLDLWEGHKKALPRSHYPTHDLFRLITILDEHQVAFDGLRVDQALGLAIRQGWLDNQPLAPAPALLDLVLADPPSPSGASG